MVGDCGLHFSQPPGRLVDLLTRRLQKDKNRAKPPLAYVGAAHPPLDLWNFRFLSELKSALPHTNHALFHGLIIHQRTINHACGDKPICLSYMEEKLRGFWGHEFSVIGFPLCSAMIFWGFCGFNMPKACPYRSVVEVLKCLYLVYRLGEGGGLPQGRWWDECEILQGACSQGKSCAHTARCFSTHPPQGGCLGFCESTPTHNFFH